MLLQNLKKSLAAFLIVCVMAPGFYMGMAPAPEANADMASIFGGAVGALAACVVSALMVSAAVHVAGQVLSLLFSVPTNETNIGRLMDNWTTAGMTTTKTFKECILDALAWALKSIIIEVILSAIVDWINKGFEGGPAFLSDPDGFFKKLAFGTLDMFINESGLDALLCAPFKDDVLDTIRTYDARVQIKSYECSLDSIMQSSGYDTMVTDGNISFAGGGIFEAMNLVKSGNNPYSALFNVQAEANDRIARAQGQEKMLLNQGNGFFSLKCDINNDGVMEACTPGNFVAVQLNNWMGGGLKQLEAADEVSEIVASVVSVLVQKTLFDDKEGLLSGYAKNADGTKRSSADIQKEWADAGYDQNYKPGAEQKYTGSGSGANSGQQQVAWKDPKTGVVWTKSDSGTLISSNGLEVVSDGAGGYKDASTGGSVNLGSTVGGMSVSDVLDSINWETVAVTALGFAAKAVGVPAPLVTAIQLGYGLVSGNYGTLADLENGYELGRLGLTPGSVLEQDPNNPNNPGGWDNPDTPNTDPGGSFSNNENVGSPSDNGSTGTESDSPENDGIGTAED